MNRVTRFATIPAVAAAFLMTVVPAVGAPPAGKGPKIEATHDVYALDVGSGTAAAITNEGTNDGHVVGDSDTGNSKHPKAAFFWDGSRMQNLNDISTGPKRSYLLTARKINNADQICGDMEIMIQGSHEEHAVICIPTNSR